MKLEMSAVLLAVSLSVLQMQAAELGVATSGANRQPSDYSHYRGDGSGSGGDHGLKLIDSWDKAKLVWNSEEPCPPYGKKNARDNDPRTGVGGFAVPVIAKGRVYVTFLVPTGPEVKNKPDSGVDSASPVQPLADEVVICMDAKTGKTLWRTVYPEKGWNFAAVYASDGQITPCIAQDCVVFMGATGWAYCLDAITGAKIWEKPTGKDCLAWQLYMQAIREDKDQPARRPNLKVYQDALTKPPPPNPAHGGSGGGGFNSTPRIFGDPAGNGTSLVIFNVLGEILALDLKTGEQRWRRGNGSGPTASVLKWTHQGKEYLIAGGGCYDPATGKLLWSFARVGGAYNGQTPAISGDYWVGTTVAEKNSRDVQVSCYRLSPTGGTLVWQHKSAGLGYMSPVIHRGRVYASMAWDKRDRTPEEIDALTGGKGYAGPPLRGGMDVCFDLATGQLKAAVPMDLNDQGTSVFAMEDRVFFHGRFMMDVQPQDDGTWKHLAELKPQTLICTFPTGADGYLYIRPRDRSCLVQCWDLRRK